MADQKRTRWNSTLPNPSKPIPRSLSRTPRKGITQKKRKAIPKVNPARKAKRAAKFAAYLRSAAWKALRIARFRLDGWRCTATVMVPNVADDGRSLITDRCPNWDETRSGKGLICDHKTYARFGHENLDDLQTLCRSCNARETVTKRANHANGFNNGVR